MPDLKPVLAYCSLIIVCVALIFWSTDRNTYVCYEASGNQVDCSELYDDQAGTDEVITTPEQPSQAPEYAPDQNQTSQANTQTSNRNTVTNQERMLQASEKLTRYSYWNLVIGSLGALAIFIALIFNYISTKAAVNTVRSQRAWVIYSECSSKVIRFGKPNEVILASLSWVNSGKSPAMEVVFVNKQVLVDYSLIHDKTFVPDIPIDDKELQKKWETHQGTIAPGKHGTIPIKLTGLELRQILRKQKVLFVRTIIYYKDIFEPNKTRVTDNTHFGFFSFSEHDYHQHQGVPKNGITFSDVGTNNRCT